MVPQTPRRRGRQPRPPDRFRLLTIAACCWLLVAFALTAFAQEAEPPYALTADQVEFDVATMTSYATGNAVLTRGDISLRADSITANRATGEVTAVGHVVLRQAARKLQGTQLSYNMNTDAGVVTSARIFEQGVLLQGERVEFSPTQAVAHNASFTTCLSPNPDYRIAAEKLTLTPNVPSAPGQEPTGGRLTLTHARIYYHNRHLLSLPNYSTSVSRIEERQAGLLPTFGYSGHDGPFVGFSALFGEPTSPLSATLLGRLTTKRSVRATFEAIHPVRGGQAYLDLTLRQDVSEGVQPEADQLSYNTANVLVNRLPEIGLRTRDRLLPNGMLLTGTVSAGSYTELDATGHRVLERADRVLGAALVRTAPRILKPKLTLRHALGLRQSFYSTGDAFTLGYWRSTLQYRPTFEDRYALSYVHRVRAGDTPFLFDEPGALDELQLDLQKRVNPAWRLRGAVWYDLDNGHTRDILLSATRIAHCLEYTIGWRKLRGTVYFGVALAPASPAEVARGNADP